MDTLIADPGLPKATVHSSSRPMAPLLVAIEPADRPEPTCECPEFCLLDHAN